MYTQVSRYSFPHGAEEKGSEIYGKAKPLWSSQAGFHSMNRYRITEGAHKDQQMVVVRFNDKASLDAARTNIGPQREHILEALKTAGIKTEETYLLDEIV